MDIKNLSRPLCNIHTISIVSEKEIVLPPELGNSWVEVYHRKNTKKDQHRYIAKINTHKWRDELTFSYRRFLSDMFEIEQSMNIKDCSLSRVDFAFNFLEDNYNELHKLNKCLCLLIGLSHNLMNRYESIDPLTLDKLTVRVQSQYLECENYNKSIQSNHWSPIPNRLELRSKAILKANKDIPALANDWCKRLDNAVSNYKPLQTLCNEVLIKKWHAEKGEAVKTLSEFLRKYQYNVFNADQLEEFFCSIGKKPKASAKSFKRNNSIEFFDENDLRCYVEILKEAVENYFSDGVNRAILAPKNKIQADEKELITWSFCDAPKSAYALI